MKKRNCWLMIGLACMGGFHLEAQVSLPFAEPMNSAGLPEAEGLLLQSHGNGRMRMAPGLSEEAGNTVAAIAATGAQRFRGNVYAVSEHTLLAAHDFYLVRGEAQTVHLAVYEAADLNGNYTRIHLQTVTVPAGEGFVSSGDVMVPLRPGYVYLIGAGWEADSGYTYNNSGDEEVLSFGTLVEGYLDNTSATPEGLSNPALINSRYRQRLRTVGAESVFVPELGSSVSSTLSNVFRGQRIRVDEDRILSTFSMRLNPAAATQLRFMVYESISESGPFVRIRDRTVAAPPGMSYVSSPPLGLRMKAGNYYVLGVYWPDSSAYWFRSGALSSPVDVGYGEAVSGWQQSGVPGTTLGGSFVSTGYEQRFTTAEPGALRMDSAVAGSPGTNLVDLEMNLAGVSSAELTFEYRAAGAAAGSASVILFAADNSSYPVESMSASTDWQRFSVEVAAFAAGEGITPLHPVYAVVQAGSSDSWPAAGWELRNVELRVEPDLIALSQVPSSTRYTFKGFDSPKLIPLSHSFEFRGGSDSLGNQSIGVEYNLDLNPGTFAQSEIVVVDFPAGSVEELSRPFTLTVPSTTKLPLTLYGLSVTLDPLDTFSEVREGNNAQQSVIEVNHYSGRLWFNNVETELTITEWSRRQFLSNTLHEISGTGVINGRVFAFEDLAVVKDLDSLDYSLDAAENAVITLAPLSEQVVSGVRYQSSGNLFLSREGLFADVVVTLPAGLGWSQDSDRMDLETRLTFPAVPLDSTFEPAGPRSLNGFMWIAEETKPLMFEVNGLIWTPSTGSFSFSSTGTVSYVREAYLQALEDAVVNGWITPEAAMRRSNSGYYRFADIDPGEVVLVETGAGGQALLTTRVSILPGDFLTHMPYNSQVAWDAKGLVNVVKDQVAADSGLPDAGPLLLGYNQNCPDTCPDAVSKDDFLIPTPADFQFTPQGGLVTEGLLNEAKTLAWGRLPANPALPGFAQQAGPFSAAAYLASGHFIRGDGAANVLGVNAPGWLMNLGAKWDQPGVVIDPMMATYYTGEGRYPGLNFRMLEHPAAQGFNVLGGISWDPFDLSSRAKYYVRHSGVTGIHEAEAFTQGGKIYGYSFKFSNLGFSYLSSSPVPGGSRTNGNLTFEIPINDVIEFEELTATCKGELGRANPAPGNEFIQLEYWNLGLTLYNLEFRRSNGCAVGSGTLVASGTSSIELYEELMFAELALGPDHDILQYTRNDIGVESRFVVPSQFEIPGRLGQRYNFVPSTKAYLNDWATADAQYKDQGEGYFSLAGRLNVPFFESIFSHLHFTAGDGDLFIMGGWPVAGWNVEGKHFFNQERYDAAHLTWPLAQTLTVDEYRSTTLTAFQPAAHKDILGIVEVRYPLEWNSSIRSFKSPRPEKDRWLATTLEHQVDYMDAENVEVSFGLQYDGLPRLNLANFVFDQLDEQMGIARGILDAGAGEVMAYLERGLRGLNKLLKPISGNIVEPLIEDLVEEPLNRLYDDLLAEYDNANENFVEWLDENLATGQSWTNFNERLNEQVRTYFYDGIDSANPAASVDGFFQRTNQELDAAIQAVNSMTPNFQGVGSSGQLVPGLLSQNPQGQFPVLQGIGFSLLQIFAQGVIEAVDEVTNEALTSAMEEVQRPLMAVTEELEGVKQELVGLQTKLNEAEGDLKKELKSLVPDVVLGELDLVQQYANDAMLRVHAYLKSLPPDRNALAVLDPQEFVDTLKEELVIEFLASDFHHQVTTAIRSRLYDIEGRFRNAADSAFASLNSAIKETLSGVLTEIDDTVNSFAGDLEEYVGAGQIDGYAHIRGESLERARIDGSFQWKVPEELEFKGYMAIEKLSGKGNPLCSPGPGFGEFAQARKISVGALELPCSWLGSDVTVDIGTYMSFGSLPDVPFPVPVGLGGQFGLSENSNSITFEEFEITELGAGAAFGKTEAYIAARAQVVFNAAELGAGIFFGATCNLEPLLLVDPDVGNLLGEPPLIGGYVYAEGWIPILEYDCMLNLAAGVGAGIFFFTDTDNPPTFGMKILMGAKGEALCVVTVRGEVRMVGMRRAGKFVAQGKGQISGTFGDCDWYLCIHFNKTVTVTYDDGELDVSY